MIRRSLQLMFAVCAFVGLISCSSQDKAKTPGPSASVNSNVTPTPPAPAESLETVLAERPENNKELERAWTNFKRSQKYRVAQPGETQYKPYLIWWGAEGYQGREFLIAIVVDPERTDPNRYGLVVIAAPESAGGKYKAYWVVREQDLEQCEISPSSGTVYFKCVRSDGTDIVWYRSKRQFQLKNLP